MVKIKLTITGEKVHNVGYRVFLFDEAQRLGLEGFNALNVSIEGKPGITVLAEGSEEVVDAFVEFAKTNYPSKANVDKVETEDFGERIPKTEDYFLRIMTEQMNKGVPAILDIKDNTEKMLGKQDQMLGKQDETTTILKSIKKDTSIIPSIKGDTSDIKTPLKRIEGDITDTKFSLSSFIEERYEKLEKEIAEIKATLAKIQIQG
jgi:acylphosphatase